MAKKSKAKAKKTVAKKVKRAPAKQKRPNAPLMAVKPPRERSKNTAAVRARRARIATICARTRAAQAEIDRFIADADTSDLDHLPVMVESGAARTRAGSWRSGYGARTKAAEDDEDRSALAGRRDPAQYELSMIGRTGTCSNCKRNTHPGMSCIELATWLSTARRVLSGEEDVPRHVSGIGLGHRGRSPKFVDPELEEERRMKVVIDRAVASGQLKRESAASTSREPSPSS